MRSADHEPHAPRILRRQQRFALRARLLPLLLGFLVLQPSALHAAFEETGGGGRSRALGIGLAASLGSFEGRAVNPAAGGFAERWELQTSWTRPFGLAELDRVSLRAGMPYGVWQASAAIEQFGGELYRESLVGLELSRSFAGSFALGASLRRASIDMKNYGHDSGLTGDLGLLARFGDYGLGLALEQAWSSGLERFGGTPFEPRVRLGLRVQLEPRLVLFTESIFQSERRADHRIGFEVIPTPSLLLRGGYRLREARLSLGLGLVIGPFRSDGSYDHHPWLGWTRAFSLSAHGSSSRTDSR